MSALSHPSGSLAIAAVVAFARARYSRRAEPREANATQSTGSPSSVAAAKHSHAAPAAASG